MTRITRMTRPGYNADCNIIWTPYKFLSGETQKSTTCYPNQIGIFQCVQAYWSRTNLNWVNNYRDTVQKVWKYRVHFIVVTWAEARGKKGVHIRQTTSTHVTTIMQHFLRLIAFMPIWVRPLDSLYMHAWKDWLWLCSSKVVVTIVIVNGLVLRISQKIQ